MTWWMEGLPADLQVLGETSKSTARFIREGFFDAHIVRPIIDIGAGPDPLFRWFPASDDLVRWNHVDGDAQELALEGRFMTVWASHVLEHMDDPVKALRSWWKLLKLGGKLIVHVPHREFYERQTHLPSRWSHEHKHFYLPGKDELPVTRSLVGDVAEAIPFRERNIILLDTLNEGWYPVPLDQHPVGEYSIRCVVQKVGELEDYK